MENVKSLKLTNYITKYDLPFTVLLLTDLEGRDNFVSPGGTLVIRVTKHINGI